MENATTRFTDRVENYIKYRPGYPQEIIPFLTSECGLDSSFQLADIGSGTGISTRLFLQNGNKVYAVEPNDAMRAAAEESLRAFPGFISMKGTAEETGLPDESVDLITAGQSFHWFDAGKAKTEFKRIGKENTFVVLIWNERQTKSPFEKEYESLLKHFASDYDKVDHRNITAEKLSSFYQPQPLLYQTFYNEQLFDFDGLKGRILSSSYVPNYDHPAYGELINALRQCFDNFQEFGKIKLEYETNVYLGKIK